MTKPKPKAKRRSPKAIAVAAPAPKRGVGQPTKYTPALYDEIIRRMSEGEPLAKICRDKRMPAPQTVRAWGDGKPEISSRFARAREAGEDWLAAECLVIADTPEQGMTEKYERVVVPADDEDGEPTIEFRLTERKTEDMLGHRKLRIETRLKLLAKFNPKKYGDRLALDHGVTDELAERMRASRERLNQRK